MYRPSFITELLSNPSGILSMFLNLGVLILVASIYVVFELIFEKLKKLSTKKRWLFCFTLLPIMLMIMGALVNLFSLTLCAFFDGLRPYSPFLSPIITLFLAVPIYFHILYKAIPSKQLWFMLAWVLLCFSLIGFQFKYGQSTGDDFVIFLFHCILFIANTLFGFNYYRLQISNGKEIEGNPFNYYLFYCEKLKKNNDGCKSRKNSTRINESTE